MPGRFPSPNPLPLPPNTVSIRWFGTAAFRLELNGSVLWIDPYLSRAGVWRSFFRPLELAEPALSLLDRADLYLVGHSHFDHLADLPTLWRRAPAPVVGSASTVNLMRASGVPASALYQVTAGDTYASGPFQVAFLPGRHGHVLGRVPMPGDIAAAVKPPFRLRDFACGEVFNLLIRAGNLTFYHQGSGGRPPEGLAGIQADVVALGLSSRRGAPGLVGEIIRSLQPRVFIPMHYDWFFRSLDRPLWRIPGVDLEGACQEALAAALATTGRLRLVPLPLGGELRLPA